MNRILILIAALGFTLASCEKVINIDLNKAAPKYVIEAEMFEGRQPVKIKVSLSTDYYGRDTQKQVNDAVVRLQLPNDSFITATSLGEGYYQIPEVHAQIGETYRLTVTVGNNTFTSKTTVPRPIPIDSMYATFRKADFQDEGYEVTGVVEDIKGEGNYYRQLQTLNGVPKDKVDNLVVFDDKFNDGKEILLESFDRYKKGDVVDYELRTMDSAAYEFYYTLNETLNNGEGGPAPSNPISNISGGALGYFACFGVTRNSIVVQ
jgi:hypothetical protein